MSEVEPARDTLGELAPDDAKGWFTGPKAWFRLGFALICVALVGVAMTVRGMIAAYNRVAALGGEAGPSSLAQGMSDALVWVVMGMLFFWPGVVIAGIGFCEKYGGRTGRNIESGQSEEE